MRFRNIIAVGFIKTSPREMVGNSRGKPPALHTPRLTASATCLRCALQLVSSDHELAMRSEEHTSELQSQSNLVCRLLLEKKKEKLDIWLQVFGWEEHKSTIPSRGNFVCTLL